MALDHVHLNKLLKVFFLPPNERRAAIREDIRREIAKESGADPSGGDFYGPFWADAKDHVFNVKDLHEAVDDRIDANPRRSNLYPRLRDGFLLWWDERRRWTNEPFTPGNWLRGQVPFADLEATVKVENVMSVRDGLGVEHVVYPYFASDPPLTDAAARLGLWALATALPTVSRDEIRILDVFRGQTFSLDRNPFHGDEEDEFRRRYSVLLSERDALMEEYV